MKILHLSLNISSSHLSCATDTGFIIFKLSPTVERKIYTELHAGVSVMNMLNASNISVLVGGGDNPFRSKDTVVVWDDHKKSSVLEIEFKEPVNNVLITEEYIVVVTEKKISMCKLAGGAKVISKNTGTNSKALCKISGADQKYTENLKIVTVGQNKGEVCVWTPEKNTAVVIKAHINNIETVAINDTGTMIATCSEIGTNIHIYCTKTSKLLYKLKRGSSKASIHSICFDKGWGKDKSNSFLACCSSNGTVHIFDINPEDETKSSSTLSVIKNYLPEYFTNRWSFQKKHLEGNSNMICSFDSIGILHIASYEGFYYKIPYSDGKYDQISKSSLHLT